jgi:hypothetical protein
MRPHGIPIAQIDSNTEADPKFLRLRLLAGAGYYAAFGTYLSIALRAWATASRTVDPDLVGLMDPGTLALLAKVGLLDPDGCIPEAVFGARVGTVLAERDARYGHLANIASEGGRRRAETAYRASDGTFRVSSPNQPDPLGEPAVTGGLSSHDIQPSSRPYSTLLSSSLSSSSDERETVPSVGLADDRALDAYSRFVTYPSPGALQWLDDLVESYGDEATARAIGEAGTKGSSTGLLQRTKGILALAARNAEKAEKAQEKVRLAEKRKPDPFLAEYKAAIVENYGDGR